MFYHLGEMTPEIDGILYDDLWHIKHPATRVAIIARGLAWETEFMMGENDFCGCVLAVSREEAEKISDARGLGEKVLRPWVDPVVVED